MDPFRSLLESGSGPLCRDGSTYPSASELPYHRCWVGAHAASRLKQAGRDVNLELWRASGLPMPEDAYIVPMTAERLASELNVPVFWILTDASLEVRFPRCQPADALLDAFSGASKSDRGVLQSLLRGSRPVEEQTWLDAPGNRFPFAGAATGFQGRVNREEIHGPWRLLRHATFPSKTTCCSCSEPNGSPLTRTCRTIRSARLL